MSILYGAAPPADGSGKKAIEERYNISYDYIPVAAGEYSNKLGVTFASGDTSDLVLFPYLDSIYFNAVNSDQFLPLETYLADAAKYPNFAKLPPDTLNLLKLNGHIYGVPRLRAIPGKTMTIRKDWLDKLGLKVPTTYDELYDVMKAFKEKDPDGNGKDDTYGTSIGVDTNYIIGIDAMMDSAKAGPGIQAWVEDGKGGIVPSEFAPNNKESLTYLAKLYKDGLIPKDFAIRKQQQVEDDFLLGKAGITSNYAFTGFNKDRLDKARLVNPKFEMEPIPPVKGLGSAEGAYMKQPGFFGIFGLNKNLAKDEGKLEKVLKMLDDQIGDEGANFIKWGVEGIHYKLENGVKVATELGQTEGPSKYALTNHAQEGEWTIQAADTPEVIKLKQDSAPIAMTGTPWLAQETGLYSKAFADKNEELKKFMTDGMIKIVIGEQPVDSVDKLFEDWKSRGGQQMLEEMTAAWKARK
ncbi:unnamed protein product [Aphanomyces euteiches]